MQMFFANPYYYYVVIGLQVICVIHCIRRGNPGYWIWLIIFLPFVGCLAYIFTEIITKRKIKDVQSGMGTVFNPAGKIKRLESNLRFSDTFNNRVALADAYLQVGMHDKAIELYESSLVGNFTENEYVFSQLILAHFHKKNYEKVIPLGKKLSGLPQFTRSRPHLYYALSLQFRGHHDEAESEYLKMKSKFANYEARYHYAKLLLHTNRYEEAQQLLSDIVNEASHLNYRERRDNRQWFQQSKIELEKIKSYQS
jgi:hypothetical protein